MEIIKEFCKMILGKCYLVGGAVIDMLQDKPIKDWDIEVFNTNLSEISSSLVVRGLNADMVGSAFGVIKTKYKGLDIDLSIPRRDNKTGIGHKDFSVEFDPSMSVKDAARRRDLTINSMSIDIETGELVDPFCGKVDLDSGILRATDPDTFVEDPLRVLRIMQLLPRKGNAVAYHTLKLCQSMVDEFSSLTKERVFAEFEKLMLKARIPSIGIIFLRHCKWINHFPELAAMVKCRQNSDWHPEGDVWTHTMNVIDCAAKYRDVLPEDWRLPFMFGALLHDVGKPSTTLADLTSHGHESEGVLIAEKFLDRAYEIQIETGSEDVYFLYSKAVGTEVYKSEM